MLSFYFYFEAQVFPTENRTEPPQFPPFKSSLSPGEIDRQFDAMFGDCEPVQRSRDKPVVPSQCMPVVSGSLKRVPSNSQMSATQQMKCTPEEIARKREEAMKKRKAKIKR